MSHFGRDTAISESVPPHNIEAERGVLGACLTDVAVLDDVLGFLRPEDFYRASHEATFRFMARMRGDGLPVDIVTLAEEMGRAGELGPVGGFEGLEAIYDSAALACNGTHYGQIVKQKATIRSLMEAANLTLRECYSNEHTAAELIERAEGRIFAAGESEAVGETEDVSRITATAIERIRERSRGHFGGITSGFTDLDEMLDGFHGSQMIVIAARPGLGKTAFALNIAEWVTLDLGRPVLFVSLEMNKLELTERLLVSRARIEGHKVRSGSLTEDEWQRTERAGREIRGILIDDTAIRSAPQIAANSLRQKARHDIAMVVVDYIQLVEPESGKNSSRQEQVAKISRRLKILAKQLNVPVLALSQLNRDAEKREDRKPRMADLRESGAIEQDADVVLLLHRPDAYDEDDHPGDAYVIVGKNRNGRTGTVELDFRRSLCRFENRTPNF